MDRLQPHYIFLKNHGRYQISPFSDYNISWFQPISVLFLSLFKRSFLWFFVLLFVAGNLFAQESSQSSTGGPSPSVAPQPNPGQWIVFNLKEGASLITKKPRLEGRLETQIRPESLLILLDSTDITQVVEKTPQGFAYDPILVLKAGSHNLNVTAIDKNGQSLQKSLSFSTKHTEKFDEIYSSNEATLNYEGTLLRAETNTSIPHSKIEGNLQSTSKVKHKEWEVTFNTNLRYLDQREAVIPPQKIGIDAVNWLLTAKYQKEFTSYKGELGDVTINESPFSAQYLSRKGGTFAYNYKGFDFRAFSVLSKQIYGFGDESTVKLDSNDHIMGTSAGLKLLKNRMEIRGIYINGGEQGSSFGISTTSGPKKGDVFSLLVNSDFFQGMLKSELEAGFARIDTDTSDTVGIRESTAYRFKLFGYKNNYNYEALYEYLGKNYEVIGNSSIQKDKQGLSLKGGGNFNNFHQINATLLGYHDNVEGDSLFARTYTYQGSLDYGFNKIQQLPLGINYQRAIQESTSEPSGTTPIKNYTDTLSGRITYRKGPWNLGVQASYSAKDDQTSSNSDTSTVTYTFTPSFTKNRLSITPSFSLNQTFTPQTDVRADNYMINFTVSNKAFRDRLSYDLTGTYNIIKANNDSQNSSSFNGNFRISYFLGKYLWGYFNPSIGLKGIYDHVVDRVNSSNGKDEFSLLFVFSSTIPFGI